MNLYVFAGLAVVIALICAVRVLRVFSAYPADERLIREYFALRGQKLLQLRLVGAENLFSRNPPVAKYDARIEHQNEVYARVVGVDGGRLGEPRLWVYRADHGRERAQ